MEINFSEKAIKELTDEEAKAIQKIFSELSEKISPDDLKKIIDEIDFSNPKYIDELKGIAEGLGVEVEGLVKRVDVSLPNTNTIKNLTESISNSGLTNEEFIRLMQKSSSKLTSNEAKLLESIRNSVPMPNTNTPLQKVVNPNFVDGYLDGSFINYGEGKIGGCITSVEGAVGLTTPESIYEGLRLDYTGTPFKPTDNSTTVIRFTSQDAGNIKIPYGDSMPNPTGGKVSLMTEPFTGHGFTSATNSQIIPEFYTDGLTLKDGAQMIEITSNGKEVLKAVFNENLGRFVLVN